MIVCLDWFVPTYDVASSYSTTFFPTKCDKSRFQRRSPILLNHPHWFPWPLGKDLKKKMFFFFISAIKLWPPRVLSTLIVPCIFMNPLTSAITWTIIDRVPPVPLIPLIPIRKAFDLSYQVDYHKSDIQACHSLIIYIGGYKVFLPTKIALTTPVSQFSESSWLHL